METQAAKPRILNSTLIGIASGSLSSKQRLPSGTLIGLASGNPSSRAGLPGSTRWGWVVQPKQLSSC